MAKKVSKPKVVKDFDKLPKDIQTAIKAEFPNGFSHKLISYTTPKGEKVMALPFEGEEWSYLVRVTVMDSRNVVREDDDDDDKPVRDDLDLDGLDIDGLKAEDDVSTDDDEEEDYVPARRRRGGSSEDDDDSDEDY